MYLANAAWAGRTDESDLEDTRDKREERGKLNATLSLSALTLQLAKPVT